MNFEKLTSKSQEAISRSQEIAKNRLHHAIEDIHLLKGIVEVDENVLDYIFKRLNINPEIFNKALDSQLDSMQTVTGTSDVYLSQETAQSLNRAEKLSRKNGDEYVSIDMLLAAIAEGKSTASKILNDSGINHKNLMSSIEDLRKGQTVKSQTADANFQALNRYARNLNEMAQQGKLDPVIGRDEEIRRVLQILSRRTKNNPILVGEPGVGKTAIAEGIAHRIINKDVPENLCSKVIYSLDMGLLIAGAKYKG